MKIRSGWAFLGVLCLTALARADDPQPPPPDVQRILQKARAGQPPTPEERQVLRAWESQRLGKAAGESNSDAANGSYGMPADVAAIIQKARQGIAPSPAEVARLKAWGAQAKQHKGQMIDTEKQITATYRGATPDHPTQRGPVTDTLVHGVVGIDFDQRVDYTEGSHTGFAHNAARVQIPVVYILDGTTPGGDFHLTCRADATGKANLAAPTGAFTMEGHETGPRYKSDLTGGGRVAGGPLWAGLNKQVATAYNPSILEIRRPSGAARAYLLSVTPPIDAPGHAKSIVIEGDHTQETAGRADFPWSGMTIDNLQAGIEGSTLGPEQLASLKQWGVDDPMKKAPPELKAALNSVSFDFNPETFTKAFSTGQFSESATYKYTIKKREGRRYSVSTSTLKLTLGVATPPKLKVLIQPVDVDGYSKWIPEGPKVPAKDGKGNELSVGLLLVDPDTKETVSQPFSATFYLRDTSKLPGWCGNYPLPKDQGADYAKPDLRFLPASNSPKATISADGQQLDSEKDHGADPVTISSFDSGAFGSLQATVTLQDGTQLEGELSPELEKIAGKHDALPIPADTNGNDIADGWEKQVGIFDRNLGAAWDGEDTPAGPSQGDGLTLFEEYRGFVLDTDGQGELFQRIKPGPRKKEFFLVDASDLNSPPPLPGNFPIVASVLQGLRIHEQAALDSVWIIRRKSETEEEPTGRQTFGAPMSQWRMNPNSDPNDTVHFEGKHYAVQVSAHPYPSPDPSTRRRACTPGIRHEAPRSPDDCGGIFLFPDEAMRALQDRIPLFNGKARYQGAWLRDRHLTDAAMVKRLSNPAIQAQLTAEELVFTVAHESGHTLGRLHHESNIPNANPLSPAQVYEHPNDPPDSCPMHYPDAPATLEWLAGDWDMSQTALELSYPPGVTDPGFKGAGWTRDAKKLPYSYCSGDQGKTQGGTGAPRYKN